MPLGLNLQRKNAGVVDRAALEMRCRGNPTGGSNPSFSATRNAPFGGLLLFKGKPRSTTLRADRGKQKRSSEAARCGLLVPPPGMDKRPARRQYPSSHATLGRTFEKFLEKPTSRTPPPFWERSESIHERSI